MSVDRLLARLVAWAPADDWATPLVRRVCAQTLGLPALPAPAAARGPADAEVAVTEFADQFSVDVSRVDDGQRSRLSAALGDKMFGTVVQMYLADFLPRVRAGLQALGHPAPWAAQPAEWSHADASGVLFGGLLTEVAQLQSLDPVTTELVRLRGAAAHNCRLCKSLREGHALDAGGSETLYEEITRFETSTRFTEAQQAALRYVDALIWSPARIDSAVAAGVQEHFSDAQAVELTLDVMRNATNKIMVSLGADAARVEHGTERYLVNADGQTVFG
ncbi:MAG TPA: carboxymuconolactone decarboxylase family protein [Mycobacterium sp.]|nr:carboxymuconolactone decarboxylase family protein [Mycobacterium sp.]